MAASTKTEEGALRGAPTIDTLRHARRELSPAIDDGASYLAELRDAIEDQLVEALNQACREREEAAK